MQNKNKVCAYIVRPSGLGVGGGVASVSGFPIQVPIRRKSFTWYAVIVVIQYLRVRLSIWLEAISYSVLGSWQFVEATKCYPLGLGVIEGVF